MYARIQTWFACNVQIGQNGREWLARQMTREGLCYHQQGNCLVGIDDDPRAQALLDQQLKTELGEVVRRIGRATESDPRDVIRAVLRD